MTGGKPSKLWHKYRKSIYDSLEWDEYFVEWFYVQDTKSKMHREFAHPERRYCMTIEQIKRQIQYYGVHKRNDVYVTLYDFLYIDENHTARKRPNYDYPILDKLWWESDATRVFQGSDICREMIALYGNNPNVNIVNLGKDRIEVNFGLQCAYNDILRLYNDINNNEKHDSILIYSGGGFHLYQRIKGTLSVIDKSPRNVLMDYRKGTLYSQLDTLEFLNKIRLLYPTIDPSGFADVARVARIPWTIHPRRKIQVIPVIPGEPLVDIVARASNWQEPRVIDWL